AAQRLLLSADRVVGEDDGELVRRLETLGFSAALERHVRVVDQELRARVPGASAVQEEARPTQDRVVAASVRHWAGTAEQLCLAGDEDPASLARHIDALGGEV